METKEEGDFTTIPTDAVDGVPPVDPPPAQRTISYASPARNSIDSQQKIDNNEASTKAVAMAPWYKKYRLFILLSLLLAVLIALAVGLGVALSSGSDENELPTVEPNETSKPTTLGPTTMLPNTMVPTLEESTSEPTTPLPTTSQSITASPTSEESTAPFLLTKGEVNNVCSAESITGDGGLECQTVCDAVDMDCCDPFGLVNIHETCLEEELQGCFAYSRCQAIQGGIPAAPSNLFDICSEESILSNRTSCEDACTIVSCCYAEEYENCISEQFLTCLDYAPCQNLRANQEQTIPLVRSLEVAGARVQDTNETEPAVPFLPVAPENLDELCSISLDSDECEAFCSLATDCLASNFFSSHFITCVTYSPCGILWINPPGAVVGFAPPGYDDVCQVDNIFDSDTGYEDCEDICVDAQCCVDPNPAVNCFLEDPVGCLSYAHCGYLFVTGGELQLAPESLVDTCSYETLRTGGVDAIEKCKAECDAASCCVSKSENCVHDGNELACASYLPCAILYVVNEVPPAPEDLPELCNHDALLEGTELCLDACKPASCCVDSDPKVNCLGENLLACLSYLPCAFVGELKPAPETLVGTCSYDALREGGEAAIDACRDVCEPASCCFTENQEQNCYDKNAISCWSYAACSILYVVDEVPPAPENLPELCSYAALQEGGNETIQMCLEACEPSSCCTDEDPTANCYEGNFISCWSYLPCAFVAGDAVPPAPDSIIDMCSYETLSGGGKDAIDVCALACEPAACCIATDEDENCYGSNVLSCLSYWAPCVVSLGLFT